MKVILETKRLILRELVKADKEELSHILCDPDSMKYYPEPFNDKNVESWIDWSINNYKKYKHGLWAVILKDRNIFLGDCGITMQEIEGELLPEIGYHIKKEFCGNGYATEAAKACIDYGFNNLNYSSIYSYTHHNNIPSQKVAEKIGMNFKKYFDKEVMGETVREYLSIITKM
ncbi:MAG: GNAT family N-acetyltransferase [Spirochaetaceae bacterium]